MLGLAHQEDLGILAPVLVAKVLTFNEKKKRFLWGGGRETAQWVRQFAGKA